jgi:hypothetical protein
MTSKTDGMRAERSLPRGISKGNARFGERALGAHDALGDGGLGDEEGSGDLVGREAA